MSKLTWSYFSPNPQLGELLKDWRRLNVAITRAKTKLLMVGSATTLQRYFPVEKLLNHLQQENMISFIKEYKNCCHSEESLDSSGNAYDLWFTVESYILFLKYFVRKGLFMVSIEILSNLTYFLVLFKFLNSWTIFTLFSFHQLHTRRFQIWSSNGGATEWTWTWMSVC